MADKKIQGNLETTNVQVNGGGIFGVGDITRVDEDGPQAGLYFNEGWTPTILSQSRTLDLSGFPSRDDSDVTISWPEYTDNRVELTIPNKSGSLAIQGKDIIEKVNNEQAIPNEELGLFRFTEEVEGITQSSHVYEVAKEDHGAEETEFTKDNTNNNGQLSAAGFMDQFASSLTNFIFCSSVGSIYTLYYAPKEGGDLDEPLSGIRFGASKSAGSITLNLLEDGTLTFRKYFSYNSSTGAIISYDTISKVIVDGEDEYEFEDDTTSLSIELEAGVHTISSNHESSPSHTPGRVILTSLEFLAEPYSIYNKNAIARVSEVQAVDTKLEAHKTESHNRFVTDEQAININRQGIVEINSKLGNIQVFQADRYLPTPTVEYLNKIYRLDNLLYQCIKTGDGVLKEWSFTNVAGTSEITGTNAGSFYSDVGNQFSSYFNLDDFGDTTTKLYRNNGSVKLGSSSAIGGMDLIATGNVWDLPITLLKISAKAYNSAGSTLTYLASYVQDEEGTDPQEVSGEVFISNNDTETVIDLSSSIPTDYYLQSLYIASSGTHEEGAEGEEVEVTNDKRLIITGITAQFGDIDYTWISSDGSVLAQEITWADLKDARDSDSLIPGMSYRITDYECTTTTANTSSADHRFDIIIKAISNNELSEEAYATKHTGDTYFTGSNLQAWKIWYCLDNDNSKFAWAGGKGITVGGFNYYYDLAKSDNSATHPFAWTTTNSAAINSTVYTNDALPAINVDTYRSAISNVQTGVVSAIINESGKGVIYRMIDEFGNEAPYDFKNIKFTRNALLVSDGVYERKPESDITNYYAWYRKLDSSFGVTYFTDTITPTSSSTLYSSDGSEITSASIRAPIIYTNAYTFNSGSSDASLANNRSCINNVIKAYHDRDGIAYLNFNVFSVNSGTVEWANNTFKANCMNNFMNDQDIDTNSCDEDCTNNVFSGWDIQNTLGKGCYGNYFNGSSYNILDSQCIYNAFIDDANYNKLGISCISNYLDSSSYNIFMPACERNYIVNNSLYNVFGNYCNRINLVMSYGNTFGSECEWISGKSLGYSIIGNGCSGIYFGEDYSSVQIGSCCNSIYFGEGNEAALTTETKRGKNIIIEPGCSYLNILCTDMAGGSYNYIQNIHIHSGVSGISSGAMLPIIIPERNIDHEIEYRMGGSETITLQRPIFLDNEALKNSIGSTAREIIINNI